MPPAKHESASGTGPGKDRPGTAHPRTGYITVSIEKREEQGEDAPPLAQPVTKGALVVGAFDGLGGAGATMIQTLGGARTSARVASHLARDVSLTVLKQAFNPELGPPSDAWKGGQGLGETLTAALKHEFRKKSEEAGSTGSRIRGGLIRPLPTTLALGLVHFVDDVLTLRIFWAGDSRVYVLLPHDGLHQLTVDDLKSRGDAMRNLVEDSPMSNLVSADGRFEINNRSVTPLPYPSVVIAATDGCFGYLRTPAHFEDLLLSSMRSAADQDGDWGTWGLELTHRLRGLTGDDSTMGMACLGWPSLQAMAADFTHRQRQVTALAATVTEAADAYAFARRAADDAKARYDDAVNHLWHAYKPGYEQLTPQPGPPVPPRTDAREAGGAWDNQLAAGTVGPEATGFGPAAPPGIPGHRQDRGAAGGDEITRLADQLLPDRTPPTEHDPRSPYAAGSDPGAADPAHDQRPEGGAPW
ncbi:hypothetical protein ACWDR3_00620 [Streptomyces sp. NPDC001002]